MVDLALLQSMSYIAGALGVCVAAFYYVMTLRVQQNNMKTTLDTRYAQTFTQWFSQGLTKEGIKHIQAIQMNPFSSIEEYRELCKNREFSDADLFWRQLYEMGGTYVREGVIPVRYLAEMNGWWHLWIWELYRDVIYEGRKTRRIKNFYYQWEYLYNTLKEYLVEHPELSPGPDFLPLHSGKASQ
jgi:hypothetical protein